ncbi:MAG: glycerate kinase [Pseudonocardiales bacterium]|nr:glycerate kinase [Actinomycetota bacterium]PZS24429.1 MAG: glycerate kinase [Pseudonocardiales bacterium]
MGRLPSRSVSSPVGDPAVLLRAMFDAAVAAADPLRRVPAFLPARPAGRVVVVGAGKAAARMAQAVEQAWDGPLSGLVVTRYGHAVPCAHIEVVQAAHPLPDAAGERAARRILELVSDLGVDDLVLALISGGGSALLALPAPGITLADKQEISTALLRSGASIATMNLVRKHLSAIKGGRLAAAAYPAATVGLLISDVPGDDPAVIASGPTVAEASTPAQALAALAAFQVRVPPAVREHLETSQGCPGPDDPRLARVANHVIATPQQSLEAAAAVARQAGVTPVILSDSLEGESREVGIVLAGIARQVRRHGQPAPAPCVLLSGGETTVTVRGPGRGGRNVELLLSLAVALRGEPQVHAIACDTDGVDGSEEVAGALIGPDTLRRAAELGVDPATALAANDGHGFFAVLDDQVVSGPTLTNVNDFRAVLIT